MSRAVGGHHSAKSKTNNWFTPRKVTDPLGSFDTDPATSINRPWDIAMHNLTRRDNSLNMAWGDFGRIWLNPPYALHYVTQFLAKLAEHGNGIALVFMRSDTKWFVRSISQRAHGRLLIAGRLHFCRISGRETSFNAGAPSVLVAYDTDNLDALAAAHCEAEYDDRDSVIWPQGKIPGELNPILFRRSVLVLAFSGDKENASWREIVSEWLARQGEVIHVADLYRAFATHPKSTRNPNWKAKLRQTLQRGAGKSIGRDQWVKAA